MKATRRIGLLLAAVFALASPLWPKTTWQEPTDPKEASSVAPRQGAKGDDAKACIALRERLQTIEAGLQKIEQDKAYKPLFDSKDDTMLIVHRAFSAAQKTVHDAGMAVGRGEPLDSSAADAFHDFLREFLMNVEEMPPNNSFGATKSPDASVLKKLSEDVKGVIALADKTPGFEEVSVTPAAEGSSAAEAATYVRRSLGEVYALLDNRTLTNVTSPGVAAGRDLRSAIDAAGKSLDNLIDADGARIVQRDAAGKPLADQLGPFKAAMKEAALQAKFYRTNYLPNSWREAHVRRAEMIEERLSPKGFEAKFLNVKALKAAPTDAEKSG